MSQSHTPTVGWREVGYFLAEMAVFGSIAWWGLSRDMGAWLRLPFTCALLALFAASWGLLVSPKAKWPLAGLAAVGFRLLWFGLGLAALVALVLGR